MLKKQNIYFDLLTENISEKQNDHEVFPGRAPAEFFKKFPPTVVFTSEFDHLRYDSLKLKEKFQKEGKLLDFQDMPGCQHGFHING